MKAAVCTKYGTPCVLKIKDIPKPVPDNSDVVIKISAFPITTPDRRIRGLNVPFPRARFILRLFLRVKFGFAKPRNPVLGNYLAGTIVAVGQDVTKFHIGEKVFAYSGDQRSTYAEYIRLSEDSVMAQKPSNLTFEETAAIPYGGGNALYFLKKAGGIKKAQKVLIYGASGAIGSTAVQLAKHHYGAEVTGVCSSANTDLVKSLGADYVMDYKKDDFTDRDVRYDLIFDAVGKLSESTSKKCLSKNGKYVSVFSGDSNILTEDFELLKKLAETGKIKPVIDKTYSFEDITDAHAYADQGHTKGIVVVNIQK